MFKKAFFNRLYGEYRRSETEKSILAKVRSGEMFGFVECDIHVPPHMEDYCSDMAPVFKSTLVGREHLNPDMLAFDESNDCLLKPQRMLVGSLFGKQILLHSELLCWYLTHGLTVTTVYQTIHYLPRNVYSQFASSVSEARRRGDSDPKYELVGTASKLCGNFFYGKTITNKERHKRVIYKDTVGNASSAIASNKFCFLEELNCDVFEIQQFPNEIKIDVPAHIGFTILQQLQLKMLEFDFDCIDRCINREDYQPIETDTDSLYLSLSGPMESILKASERRHYFETFGSWFPREACEQHTKLNGIVWLARTCCLAASAYDMRTPGLFKKEYEGHGKIALNSKTYCCGNLDQTDIKISSKGLSKRTNILTPSIYKSVLFGKTSHKEVNRGFIFKNNKMLTYSQIKQGLSYLYVKRRLLDDGITSRNTSA